MTIVKISRPGFYPNQITIDDDLAAAEIITYVRRLIGTDKFSVSIYHNSKWMNGYEYDRARL